MNKKALRKEVSKPMYHTNPLPDHQMYNLENGYKALGDANTYNHLPIVRSTIVGVIPPLAHRGQYEQRVFLAFLA